MQENVMMERIMEYAKEAIYPDDAVSVAYVETKDDETGDTNIWLLESDTGEEYWVLEGCYPMNIIKKGGIHTTAERAFAGYLQIIENEEQRQVGKDRFQLYQ